MLPRYRRIKYVSSLPVGEYKSIQKLLTEVLLRNEDYEQIYDEYLGLKDVCSSKKTFPFVLEDDLTGCGEKCSGHVRTGLPEKDELYYEAMECLNLGAPDEAIDLLKQALSFDLEYIQTYVGLEAAYRELGDFENQKIVADLGFALTRKKFPNWPKRMEWGDMANRAYMRSICDKATTLHIAGDNKTAEELYRLLLKMNPYDNQGVRYLIAGMFEGLSPEDVDVMTDEGNAKQDWSAQERMVIKQNKIHKFWDRPRQ